MKRPTGVTVVAWILIVIGALALVSVASTFSTAINDPAVHDLMAKNLLPIPVQIGLTYLGLIIEIVSGIAMLKGKNLGRMLYVVWTILASVIALITSPMKAAIVPGLVVFAVFCFFLFRPKANEYFSTVKTNA